jgi:hypothetical protein
MSAMPLRSGIVCLALSCALAAVSQTSARSATPKTPSAAHDVPTLTYRDPANGVSFRYPAAWTLSQENTFMEPPGILESGVPGPRRAATAVATFSSAGNYYAKTNLTGLEFTYVVLPQRSAEECASMANANLMADSDKPNTVTIQGVPFLHIEFADAGMCHERGADIYETYRGGKCFLFEADFHTMCPGVVEGTRALTVDETKALKRHLDGIVQTVRIEPAK